MRLQIRLSTKVIDYLIYHSTQCTKLEGCWQHVRITTLCEVLNCPAQCRFAKVVSHTPSGSRTPPTLVDEKYTVLVVSTTDALPERARRHKAVLSTSHYPPYVKSVKITRVGLTARKHPCVGDADV